MDTLECPDCHGEVVSVTPEVARCPHCDRYFLAGFLVPVEESYDGGSS